MDTADRVRLNDRFRQLRNRLRKFQAEDIVFACIQQLHQPLSPRYPPNTMIRLIEWTMLYGEMGRKPLTKGCFNNLVYRAHDFGDEITRVFKLKNIPLFFKTLAYQQFYLQHLLSQDSIVRSFLLFHHLDHSNYFCTRFKEVANVSIEDYLILASALLYWSSKAPGQPIRANQLFLSRKMSAETVNAFLRSLSCSLSEARYFLSTRITHRPRWDVAFYKESPLTMKPLYSKDDWFLPYSPRLLMFSIEHYVYNVLREDNAQEFMDHFGPVFERYVGKGLQAAPLSVLKEPELAAIVGPQSKVVDFLITAKDANIFIDAKGVEMHSLAQTTDNEVILENKLRSSLLAAVNQANETAKGLATAGTLPAFSDSVAKYLLVITYKPFYVGNGPCLAEMIGESQLRRSLPGPNAIPWSNIYFLSLEEFDALLGLVCSGESIDRIMSEAVARDKLPETAALRFSQHLPQICQSTWGKKPPHVEEAARQWEALVRQFLD